jgi:hypothetical protein
LAAGRDAGQGLEKGEKVGAQRIERLLKEEFTAQIIFFVEFRRVMTPIFDRNMC